MCTCCSTPHAPSSRNLPQYAVVAAAAIVSLAAVSWLLCVGDVGYGATLLWASAALFPRYSQDPWIRYIMVGNGGCSCGE